MTRRTWRDRSPQELWCISQWYLNKSIEKEAEMGHYGDRRKTPERRQHTMHSWPSDENTHWPKNRRERDDFISKQRTALEYERQQLRQQRSTLVVEVTRVNEAIAKCAQNEQELRNKRADWLTELSQADDRIAAINAALL